LAAINNAKFHSTSSDYWRFNCNHLEWCELCLCAMRE
jgi:hypothetical protein